MKKVYFILVLLFISASNPFVMQYIEQDKDGRIIISGDELPLKELLQQLAEKQNKNIVFIGGVDKKVQMNLRNISYNEAFNAAVTASGLCLYDNKDVIYIGKCRQIKSMVKRLNNEKKSSYSFTLRYINLVDFLPVLQKKINLEFVGQDYSTNTFTVKCNSTEANNIMLLVQQHDLIPHQIRIRAYIVSIDQDYIRQLGIKLGSREVKENHYNLLSLFSGSLSALDAELRALEQQGQGRVISAPELITMNNKMAYIETGDDIPYYEKDSSGQSTVVFKKAVLSLKFIPEVLGGKNLKLHITISQDQPGQSYTGSLSIKTRKIDTDAIVRSGESLVLGGILEQDKSTIHNGVPVLSDIPIIGEIFSLKEQVIKKRQLMVFIIPEIIL
jgi:type IV pilus assembly protein PilQ